MVVKQVTLHTYMNMWPHSYIVNVIHPRYIISLDVYLLLLTTRLG